MNAEESGTYEYHQKDYKEVTLSKEIPYKNLILRRKTDNHKMTCLSTSCVNPSRRGKLT